MEQVLAIVVLGRSARNAANCKNRQPLPEMIVGLNGPVYESGKDIIAEELNVKSVRFVPLSEIEEYTAYRFKPQLRTLGPKYGKLVPKITEALNANANANMKQLKEGVLHLNIEGATVGAESTEDVEGTEGTTVELTEADVLVEVGQRDGFAVQMDKDISVVLDIRLTAELIEEGYVRELISKIQNMRKEAGFDVMDRIVLKYEKNAQLSGVFERNRDVIAREVLADTVEEVAEVAQVASDASDAAGAYSKEWQINDQRLKMQVKKK